MKAVYNILNNQDKVTMKHFYHIIFDPDLGEGFCAIRRIPCACTVYVEELSNPGYLSWIKPSNRVMLSKQKHVSTPPSYVALITGIFSN